MNNYEDYTRISDDVYWMGPNVILRFGVSINKTNEKFGKQLSHKEMQYTDSNGNTCISIKRDFSYYLSIEKNKYDEDGTNNRIFIQIFAEDIQLLIYNLDNCMRWFQDEQFKDLFAKKSNGEMYVSFKVDPVYIQLKSGSYIMIEPSVILLKDNSYDIGVRLYLSSYDNFLDMNLFSFAGFIYTIKTFNMYSAAQNLLNYLQRPPLGTNLRLVPKHQTDNPIPKSKSNISRRVGKINMLE